MTDKDGDDGNIRYIHQKQTEATESSKNMYYQVTSVIPIKEAERLMKLHYLTESGYLDILGLLNRLQEHNLKRIKQAKLLAISVPLISTAAIILTYLWSK
jgi:hypothetical protein